MSPAPRPPSFPYTTLFRSRLWIHHRDGIERGTALIVSVDAVQILADQCGAGESARLHGRVNARDRGLLQLQSGWSLALLDEDRKSTRLNSSHLVISYAVF